MSHRTPAFDANMGSHFIEEYVTLPSDIGMQLELDAGVKCTNTS